MIESKLTHHLLSLCPADAGRATFAHPFIAAVGKGTISPARLEAWLAQDRHYILRGYLPLMGSMLARVPLPTPSQGHSRSAGLGPQSEESRLYFRTMQILSGAVANAVREAGFFEKTAEEAGFDLSVGPLRVSGAETGTDEETPAAGIIASQTRQAQVSPAYPISNETDAYLNFMSRMAHTGTFLEQLTLLWAMEILYYRAWSQAASNRAKLPASASSTFTEAQSTALSALINNWSSAEFAHFVEELGDLLDVYGGNGDFSRLPGDELARVQQVWRQTVWLETQFWYAGRRTDL
ncbi:hypothetical protein OC834_004374 [Tilletia horrida]|nr:hypothetical protein OC834_004374 [Tilletia horrida]